MKKTIYIVLVLLFVTQLGWSQRHSVQLGIGRGFPPYELEKSLYADLRYRYALSRYFGAALTAGTYGGSVTSFESKIADTRSVTVTHDERINFLDLHVTGSISPYTNPLNLFAGVGVSAIQSRYVQPKNIEFSNLTGRYLAEEYVEHIRTFAAFNAFINAEYRFPSRLTLGLGATYRTPLRREELGIYPLERRVSIIDLSGAGFTFTNVSGIFQTFDYAFRVGYSF
jgi:hypothetical protein